MDVVDKIAAIPTGAAGPYQQDVPKDPVVIVKVTQVTTP
jgi:cyclophilin family peptidyl-prolyl cis-trans isomerase